ncbi:hypothetical protein PAXINDRAFT_159354, partial [Paxillus involutus ATCC 200175]
LSFIIRRIQRTVQQSRRIRPVPQPSAEEKRAFTIYEFVEIHGRPGRCGRMASITGPSILFAPSPSHRRFRRRHGTGHGVGHFLNVHEGPQGIGTRIAYNSTLLKAGMTVSNEPGYYADGRWGICIENVVIVCEVETPNNFGNGYLGFERVTMTSLIDYAILTAEEKKWLNDYHAEVARKVGPLLQDECALAWLVTQCQAV